VKLPVSVAACAVFLTGSAAAAPPADAPPEAVPHTFGGAGGPFKQGGKERQQRGPRC
jgi:hypothetical protein